MSIMSDKEIRQILLESNDQAGWKYSIGEQMRDNLTDDQAAMLARYYYDSFASDELAMYFDEIMGPIIEKTMKNEIERYKLSHSITIDTEE